MNILHLSTFLQGGAGRVIVDLAARQRAAGCDVTVMASRSGRPGYENYPEYIAELEHRDVAVELVDSSFVRDHSENLRVVGALERRFPRGAEPSVIHAHAAIPSLIGLTFAGSRRVPLGIIQTMHGWGVSKTPEQTATDVAVLNLLDRIAVTSRHSAGQLASLGVACERVSIVPCGVGNPRTISDARDRQLVDEMVAERRAGALVVVCIGTFGWRKNQRLVIDAIARLRDRGTRVFGVFVGDGPSDDLSVAARELAIADRVRIHGYSRAARWIGSAAAAVVLASRREGQPLAVLEAFADGRMVAVSDIPELSELVEDAVTGVRFESDNVESLVMALERLCRMPPAERETIVQRAWTRYRSEFTAALMVERYFDLYRQALGQPGDRQTRTVSAA